MEKKTLILFFILTAGLWFFNKTVTLESDIHHIYMYFYLSTAHESQHMFCLRIFLFFNLKFWDFCFKYKGLVENK